MSTMNKVAAVIKAVIENHPTLSVFDPEAIYLSTPPEGVLPAISLDGVYSIPAKAKQIGSTLHIWMAEKDPSEAGDILDLADDLLAALKGTAIFCEQWTHQPDKQSAVDHVVFPITIYTDLL